MKKFLNKTRRLHIKVGLGEGTHLINKENGQKRKNGHIKQNKSKITSNWYVITKNSYVYFFLKRGGGKKLIQAPLQKKQSQVLSLLLHFCFKTQTFPAPHCKNLKEDKNKMKSGLFPHQETKKSPPRPPKKKLFQKFLGLEGLE